jgi:predicted Zn-dependent protease
LKRTLLLALLLSVFAFNTPAQHGDHRHEPSEKLGRVIFKTSCTPKAQTQFNRAVAWLHSFEYEEAEKAFNEVATTDPRCAMAHWGIGMSTYHPLWAPPTPDELKRGALALWKAHSLGAQTARERDYIAALSTFYSNSTIITDIYYEKPKLVDHRTRAFAYSEAMKQLHKKYPADQEAAIFYALTLISTGMMSNDKTYVREKEAAQILNRVLARQPQHPGVAHYLIHSYDFPVLAHLALPAARSYAKLAPASAHAQHMPSHIFIRRGLWQEAIRSNRDAENSAKAFAVRHKMAGAWDEQLHAMDYLAYAYLQSGQDKKAWAVLDEMLKIKTIEPQTFKVAYALAAIPARYALERKRWDEASKLIVPTNTPNEFPWYRFQWAAAHVYFARAIGFARLGNVDSARKEVEALKWLRDGLKLASGEYDWVKQVDIERQIAAAWLAFAEGEHDESLKLMRAVADLDDATDKHPVTPGAILPAREQLGELLLELKQPAAALQAFETSLQTAPERFNGLYGAARAASLGGDQRKARSYYAKLVALTRLSDSDRAEISEAKSFLGVASKSN